MISTFKKRHTYQLFFILLVCSINCICNNAWGGASIDQIRQWLDSHNQYRSKHQVEPVTWSTEIAASAQTYADTCPTGHSQSGYGENIAWGYSSIPEVVTAWYEEEDVYDYDNPGFSRAAGHFTQVVWKGTIEIGCALKTHCPQWPITWICQYNPPGNYYGQFAQNVFPPKAPPPPLPPVGKSSILPTLLLLLD